MLQSVVEVWANKLDDFAKKQAINRQRMLRTRLMLLRQFLHFFRQIGEIFLPSLFATRPHRKSHVPPHISARLPLSSCCKSAGRTLNKSELSSLLLGQRLVVKFSGRYRVKGQIELVFPSELESGFGKGVVAFLGDETFLPPS